MKFLLSESGGHVEFFTKKAVEAKSLNTFIELDVVLILKGYVRKQFSRVPNMDDEILKYWFVQQA